MSSSSPIDTPEILEAERRVTRPLRAHRGWVVRERVAGKWVDHPQVRWPEALAAVRKLRAETAVRLTVEVRGLEDFEDGILWAGEMAEKQGASWKKAAQHVIDCLPRVEV
jgi:hypothetical protein